MMAIEFAAVHSCLCFPAGPRGASPDVGVADHKHFNFERDLNQRDLIMKNSAAALE